MTVVFRVPRRCATKIRRIPKEGVVGFWWNALNVCTGGHTHPSMALISIVLYEKARAIYRPRQAARDQGHESRLMDSISYSKKE